MRHAWITCTLLLMFLFGGVVQALAEPAKPEFVETTSFSIPLADLVNGRKLSVLIANPGPETAVRIQVVGKVATVLQVPQDGLVRLPAGGVAEVVIAPGKHLGVASGQLLLISPAGIDRRPLAVTETWWEYLTPAIYWGVGILVLISGLTIWAFRHVRRQRRRTAAQAMPTDDGTDEVLGVFTHSDEPSASDGLNRAEYASELAHLASAATPPMVIGIFGEWGMGKTSLMRQVRQALEDNHQRCAHVWFDPWPHQYDGNPVLPLLHTIVAELGLSHREDISRVLRSISVSMSSLVLQKSVGLNLDDVRRSLREYDETSFRVRSERTRLDEQLSLLIERALKRSGKDRLVVFVDDLDRCAAEQITTLLEALTLHFNRDNCVFVLGVAKDPLIAAIREKYGEPHAVNYLDKIIQFPFEMPRLSKDEFNGYLAALLPPEIKHARPLLAIGLPRNPRTIKRFVNVLILQDRVARARSLNPYDVGVLTSILLIRDGDAAFYGRLNEDATLLQRVAEDIETAQGEDIPDWSPLAVDLVRCFMSLKRPIPADVRSYIDLVKVSTSVTEPEPMSSDSVTVTGPILSRLGNPLLEDTLSLLADRVERHVGQLVAEGGRLLDLIVRDVVSSQVLSLDDMVSRERPGLLIVGPPGSGKTTLAARITQRLLERRSGGEIPVFIRCRWLKPAEGGLELWMTRALTDEYRIPSTDAFALVSRAPLVVVLDGLDEVEVSARGRLVSALLRWQHVTGARIVLTDRGRQLRGQLIEDESFEVVRIEGVVSQDAAALLVQEGLDAGRLKGFDKALESPALLSALVAATDGLIASPGGEDVDLFQAYADWATRRLTEAGGASLGPVLSYLAEHLAVEGKEIFSIEDAEIRSLFRTRGVRGMEVAAAVRSMAEAGLIREVAPGMYHFLHPELLNHLARRSRG
ncbi:P-loop NTPase fold protein [Nonomuraea sp. NPDC050663]|uniref:P-loop NTPase fold protein n=1 Tax=Nonomuraea sp. NPDC050663 TaxID=3364370 RepID=UPI003787B565